MGCHKPHVKTRLWHRCHWRQYWKLDAVFVSLFLDDEVARRAARKYKRLLKERIKRAETYYRQAHEVN